MKQHKSVERRTMPVEGGLASVEITRYKRRHPYRWRRYEQGSDGVIRKKKYVHFIKGIQTGDCPECKQMPCHHTAILLGWHDD